jgi:CheY-like chemotaxis protein
LINRIQKETDQLPILEEELMPSGGATLPDIDKKLLIVDDEPATLILLSQIFGQKGYSVRTANDGFSALRMIRTAVPDILLSDLNMPGMSGFELLSVVRRRLPSVYVIATSGAYSGEVVPRGIAADAFYEKATGFRFLLGLMERAGEERAPRTPASDASEPMWVPETGDDAPPQIRVMIHCPDCMRSFAHTSMGTRSRGDEFRETDCVHCTTKIHYAIVQPLDPVTSQPNYPAMAALRPHIAPETLRVVEEKLGCGISLVGKLQA